MLSYKIIGDTRMEKKNISKKNPYHFSTSFLFIPFFDIIIFSLNDVECTNIANMISSSIFYGLFIRRVINVAVNEHTNILGWYYEILWAEQCCFSHRNRPIIPPLKAEIDVFACGKLVHIRNKLWIHFINKLNEFSQRKIVRIIFVCWFVRSLACSEVGVACLVGLFSGFCSISHNCFSLSFCFTPRFNAHSITQ